MANDKNMPEILKERIDLKGLTAGAFYDFVETAQKNNSLKNTKVFFYTTIGTITGTWIPLNGDEVNDDDKNTEKFHETVMNYRNDTLEKWEKENENLRLINDNGAIPLIDVTISPYGTTSKHHLTYFLLFPDQIVGISYGEIRD